MSDILLNAEEKMMGVIDNLESNLRQIRTGRASGQMLERVQVEYYGAMTPINQIAQISVVEGTQLVVKPYDRSIVKGIAHAIQAANLGLNPQAEADVIRIQVPQLTEDRRKELAKDAQKYSEEASSDNNLYFTKDDVLEEVYNAVDSLKEEEISDIIKTKYAYSIIKRLPLDDKKLNDYLEKKAKEKYNNDITTKAEDYKVFYENAYKKIK